MKKQHILAVALTAFITIPTHHAKAFSAQKAYSYGVVAATAATGITQAVKIAYIDSTDAKKIKRLALITGATSLASLTYELFRFYHDRNNPYFKNTETLIKHLIEITIPNSAELGKSFFNYKYANKIAKRNKLLQQNPHIKNIIKNSLFSLLAINKSSTLYNDYATHISYKRGRTVARFISLMTTFAAFCYECGYHDTLLNLQLQNQ